MEFSDRLRIIMTDKRISSEELAAKYTEVTGKEITSRSIRRYVSGESKPKAEIIEGINATLNALVGTVEQGGFRQIQETDSSSLPFLESFRDYLRSYGAPEKQYGISLNPQTNCDILGNYLSQSPASIKYYNYINKYLRDFMSFDLYEIQLGWDFMQLGTRDKDSIISRLEAEEYSVVKALKDPYAFDKSVFCNKMIKESETRPAYDDIYGGSSSKETEKGTLDISGLQIANVHRYVCLAISGPKLASFGPQEWYFLALLQKLKLNDYGMNEVAYIDKLIPPELIGDKMATLIFFIQKRSRT